MPVFTVYKIDRRWERIVFANVSLHLIVVQDRKVIFLPTEVLLTVVRQEIWHYIKTLRRHVVLKTDLYTIRIIVGLRWFSAPEWSPLQGK